MKLTLTGIDAARAKLRRLADRFPDEVARALYVEAQIEMTESKRRVPVDTRTLRASGFVAEPERSWRGVSVSLGYGGEAAGYAVYVHEDLEALHPHGEAKFLESVIKESVPYMAQRIAKRIDLNRIA
jgi:hypothetical protein